MTTEAQTTLRADARRNRDQIIAAARVIFADGGPDTPMEEIARTAGVGVGTLYRRFPDREALIRAVALDTFQRVLDETRAAASEEPSAWAALVRILHQSAELQLSVQLALLSPRTKEVLKTNPTIQAMRDELLTEVERLVSEAQAEGKLRADIGTGDIAQLFAMRLAHPRQMTPEASRMAAERCAMIMIDGLRAEHDTPLPWRPLTRADLGM